jgi:capsid portal protein
MGLRSNSTIRLANRAQKADQAPGRVSRSDPNQYQEAILGNYAEPPFNLDRITDMLFESDTFDAVVRQFALDACSGWALVDTDEGAPATGEISPTLGDDDEAIRQRKEAESMLDRITFDFDDQHVSVATFSQFICKDKDATGQGHIEVVRDKEGRPAKLIHIPARMIRRGLDGRTFMQLDEMERPAAFFRRFGAEVKPIDTQTGESETPWAYVSKDEASTIGGTLNPGDEPEVGQRLYDLKRELADFKTYHPRERYYGVPPIISAFNSLVGNIFASNRNVRFFVNRGFPDYVVMIKAPAAAFSDPDIRENIIDKIQNTIEEHMKYLIEGEDHRTMTLRVPVGEYEVVFEKIGGDPKDMEWAAYQEANRDNIIHAYGMQPSKLGIVESASLGTGSGESQDETYKRSQIEPRQEMLEGFWNIVLDQLGYTAVRFKYHELDVTDEQRESSILIGVAGTGALSINDIRAWASRITKDQDFPPEEMEGATIPIKLLDLQVAGLLAMAEQQTGAPTMAAGYPNPRFGAALSRLANIAGLGGPANEQTLDRLRQGTGRIAPQVAGPPKPAIPGQQQQLPIPSRTNGSTP